MFGSALLPASEILLLLMRGPVGAIVNHVTVQCHDQSRLLEEAVRDLEVFKKAYYKAENDMRVREEKFEQEKQVLSDEIHQLKVRFYLYYTFSLYLRLVFQVSCYNLIWSVVTKRC